jgi:hypothetical protein
VLGRLGSSFDPEVLVAARTAERIRRQAGLNWREILDEPALPIPAPAAEHDVAADPVGFCLGHVELLNDWERGFLASLRRPRDPLTEKQRRKFRCIIAKCWAAP